MERESFMNEEVAKILNKHFVCIKVDREERPDVYLFFQAEDGIRDIIVTGVQTCVLPISEAILLGDLEAVLHGGVIRGDSAWRDRAEIGRASCRERGEISVVAVSLKK